MTDIDKTNLITNNQKVNSLQIGGETNKSTEEAIYLGQTVSMDDRTVEEINRRITTTWNKY